MHFEYLNDFASKFEIVARLKRLEIATAKTCIESRVGNITSVFCNAIVICRYNLYFKGRCSQQVFQQGRKCKFNFSLNEILKDREIIP